MSHPAFALFDPPLPALPRAKHPRKPKKVHKSVSSGLRAVDAPLASLNTPDYMSASLAFEDFFGEPGEVKSAPLPSSSAPPPFPAPQSAPVKTEPFGDSIFDFFPPTTSSCALQGKSELDSPWKPSFEQQLPQEATSDGGANNNGGDVDASLEIYRDLILRHLVTDIASTCAKLRISTDPEEWRPEQTAVWASEMGAQFGLGPLDLSRLRVAGRRLASLTRDELLAASPQAGDTLHAQLQIWKTAADFRRLHSSPPPSMVPAPRHEAAEWLAQWDPEDSGPFPNPAAAQGHHFQAPNGYNLCVQTGPGSQYGSAAKGGGYAHLLSPSDSDSGISADLEEDPRAVQRMPGQSTGSIHLWQFIRELLDHPDKYAQCVRWIDRGEGVFKIEDSHKLARLWGQRKNRHKMNYDKLSRSLRQYYKKGIIRKTGQRQRLIYQFIPPYHLL